MALTALKGNKAYSIDEMMKSHYLENGYDIYDDKGKIVAHGKGKTVPYEEYMKVKEELDALKKAQKKASK